jgi:apolipoprotein N-acyltransferase
LAPLLVAVSTSAASSTWRRAFALGACSGVVGFAGVIYWIAGVMHRYGDLPFALAALICAGLIGYLAIFFGVWAVLVRASIRRLGVGGVWLAPIFWVALEWARGVIVGFPWAPIGSSQATVIPVVQLAAVTGVYGLSALVALVSTAAAVISLTRARAHRAGAACVALLLIGVCAAGAYRVSRGTLTTSGRPLRVGLVQGSIAQDEKDDPSLGNEVLARYLSLSRQAIGAGAQMVLWPEASVPFYFDIEAPKAAPIRRLALETRTPFLLGSDAYDPPRAGAPERFYNAAVLVGGDGRSVGTYRKMRLVPFGEYVPFKSLLFFAGKLVQSVGDFSPGTEPVVFDTGDWKISVSICYESIYPRISRAFVAGGSELLATITNDAWFDRSSAAYQHFDQGAIRAVEEGRYVVRAANTGISGAVDPYGRALTRTPLFQPLSIVVDVRLLTDRTIYSRTGDLVVWLSLAVTAAFVLTSLRRAR